MLHWAGICRVCSVFSRWCYVTVNSDWLLQPCDLFTSQLEDYFSCVIRPSFPLFAYNSAPKEPIFTKFSMWGNNGYANAPQCYVMRTLSCYCLSTNIASWKTVFIQEMHAEFWNKHCHARNHMSNLHTQSGDGIFR